MNTPSIYKTATGEQQVMALYDAVLVRWPVLYTTARVATRHGGTFVIASGPEAAPPLILLHGSSSNAVSWVGDVSAYSRHFRSSSRLTSQSASTSWCCSRPAVLRRCGLPSCCGPSRCRCWAGRGAEAINRIVFGIQPVHPEAVKFMNVIMTNFRPRIEPQALFTNEELKRLTMPVLLLIDAQDALLPVDKIAARLQGLLPNLITHLFPDMGHVLHNMAEQVIPFLLTDDGRRTTDDGRRMIRSRIWKSKL